jgi:hypothetical protein
MPLKRLTMTRTKSRATSVGRHRRNSGAHTLLSYRDAVEAGVVAAGYGGFAKNPCMSWVVSGNETVI